MVQILPREPGLGELLGGGMGQGMQQGFEQMRQGSALGEMLGLKPEEIQALGQMPAQMQQVLGAALIKQKMQEAETSNILNLTQRYKANQGMGGQPVSPNQPTQPGQTGQPQSVQPTSDKFVPPNDQDLIDILSSSSNKAYQNRANVMMEENKEARKDWRFTRKEAMDERALALKEQDSKRKQMKQEGIIPESQKKEYSNLSQRILKLAKENPYLMRITPFSEGGAEIKALGEQMFAAIRDKVVKGNLSKPVFEYIKNAVTVKPTDTNAQIRGKINAFKRYAQILKENKDYSDLSIEDVKKMTNAESSESTKTLTKEKAQAFLKGAKGDKEKARETARKLGYEF